MIELSRKKITRAFTSLVIVYRSSVKIKNTMKFEIKFNQ